MGNSLLDLCKYVDMKDALILLESHKPRLRLLHSLCVRAFEFPTLIYLGKYYAGVYQHECTGTIVSPTVVITAAHCTANEK